MSTSSNPLPLDGAVVVVTGGNSGIGLGMSKGLVAAGASVSIWGRNEGKNERAAEELRSVRDGADVLALRCDVSDLDAIVAAMDRTVHELGPLTACVANAGVSQAAPFLDIDPETWRSTMAVNLDGVFFTLQTAARQMVAQGTPGALVATSSTSTVHGAPNNAHYGASKSGVIGLVKAAAVALARHQIRVNALVPGWTKADLTEELFKNEKFAAAALKRTPVRRWGEPSDFADIAVYLCNPAHGFHTGDSVLIDGGYTTF